MTFKQSLFIGALAGFIFAGSGSAFAQFGDVQSGQLGAAQRYEAGLLDPSNGGLDAALWQGTSAQTAGRLLAALPEDPQSPIIKDMIRAVVLSNGAPPESDSQSAIDDYQEQKMAALFSFGGAEALSRFVASDPVLAQNATIRGDLALASGDVDGACQIADQIKQGRAEPYWAKLRSFCHIERGELPAAELTTSLLRDSGHEAPLFFEWVALLTGAKSKPSAAAAIPASDPLISVMQTRLAPDNASTISVARDSEAKPEDRLAALFDNADLLSDDDIFAILSELSVDPDDLAGSSTYDLQMAIDDPGARGTARMFQLARSSTNMAVSARALADFLERSDKAGAFDRMAALLANEISMVPGSIKADAGWKIFTRIAVASGDISTLQGIYSALPADEPGRARLALASDALGNGFVLGPLGQDIEARLTETGSVQSRALRDSYIALALGARLSTDASIPFEQANQSSGKRVAPGALWALDHAAKAGSRAETVLRAVTFLESGPLDDASFGAVVAALQEAGLTQFSGRLAAQDFLSGL